MSIEYGLDGHLLIESDDGFLYAINADDQMMNYYDHEISALIVELAQKIHRGLYGEGGHLSLHNT